MFIFKMIYEFNSSSQAKDKNEIKSFQKLLRRSCDNTRFFNVLNIQNEELGKVDTVNVGDTVLVANADELSDYIAIVDALYDYGHDLADDKYAIVTWFFQPSEIPASKLPPESKNEIFLSTAKLDNVIDAETISGLCTVHFNHASDVQKPADNVFYCTKSFDGRHFKNLPDRISRHEVKTIKHVKKPHVKVIVSDKSIFSTLSPKKDLAKSRPMLVDTFSSPVSASSIGRLDASAVAYDILGSDGDENCSDAIDNLAKRQSNSQSVSKKTTRPCTNALSIEPLQEDITNTPTLRQTKTRLKEMSVSVKKLSGHTKEKENRPLLSSQRLSTRGKKVSGSSPSKRIKISEDANYTSDEDNLFSTRLNKDKTSMKKPKRLPRRSARQPAKQTAKSNLKQTEVSNRRKISFDDEEAILDDSDVDADFQIENLSDSETSNDSDFVLSEQTPRKRTKTSRKSATSRKATVKPPKDRPISRMSGKNRRACIPERKTPLKLAASDLDLARERLHVSAVPDSLPCRESEFEAVYSFIEGKINSGTGGCMYISGVPGTGKTATVMEVVSCLRESVADGMLQEFNFVDINGMRLTEPHQAYVSILKQLSDKKATPDHAAELLTKHFNMRGKKSTLMIVDELDLLWTRKQDVLYHFFDWPSHRHARLIVVAIANTMDLPERIMMNKVSSRLGLTRLAFLPYSFKQLQEIVLSRLQGLPVFDSDAIQLVARKVAAVSGDARRCLDVCRRAIEIADKNRKVKHSAVKAASIEQVHEALQEMFASPMLMMMRNCSLHEKLFLNSVVAEFKRSGFEEATLGQILHHHASLSQMEGIPPASESSLMEVCNHLVASRLLLLESGAYNIYSRIRLNVSVDDVLFALNKD